MSQSFAPVVRAPRGKGPRTKRQRVARVERAARQARREANGFTHR